MTKPSLQQFSRSLSTELRLLEDEYSELSGSASRLLREVELHGVRTIAELVDSLELDKSTLSRLVKSQIEQGYLKAVSSPGDQRRKPLQITKKGKDQLRLREEYIRNRIEAALSLVDGNKQGSLRKGFVFMPLPYVRRVYSSSMLSEICRTRMRSRLQCLSNR